LTKNFLQNMLKKEKSKWIQILPMDNLRIQILNSLLQLYLIQFFVLIKMNKIFHHKKQKIISSSSEQIKEIDFNKFNQWNSVSSQLKIVEYSSKCDILFSFCADYDIIKWQLTKIIFNVFAYNMRFMFCLKNLFYFICCRFKIKFIWC
jgi:hypothetical protein